MPAADFSIYCQMLDRALCNHFAYPAINVLEVNTLNAAIEGFAAAHSDGIIQISVAAGTHTAGCAKDAALGAITLAEHARRIAESQKVYIAIHTDHCPTDKIQTFLQPLIDQTRRRRTAGLPNLFNSHMYDGSALSMVDNMNHATELLKICAANQIILEVEAGVVGGEEEGHAGGAAKKLYTTADDMVYVYERLSQIDGGKFMLAATFGNVHGVYKPGNVMLKPKILRDGQEAAVKKYGEEGRLWLVFHGGSGTTLEEFRESIRYGIVKVNIHTDTQYTFSRAVADYMFRNYDRVMRIDGEMGVKNAYLASTWLEVGRTAMVERVAQACEDLQSAGKSLF